MDLEGAWLAFTSLLGEGYRYLVDNNMVIWAFVIVVVALIVLDIPSKLRKIRGPPRTPQTTCMTLAHPAMIFKSLLAI
jgi:hypothetical protein